MRSEGDEVIKNTDKRPIDGNDHGLVGYKVKQQLRRDWKELAGQTRIGRDQWFSSRSISVARRDLFSVKTTETPDKNMSKNFEHRKKKKKRNQTKEWMKIYLIHWESRRVRRHRSIIADVQQCQFIIWHAARHMTRSAERGAGRWGRGRSRTGRRRRMASVKRIVRIATNRLSPGRVWAKHGVGWLGRCEQVTSVRNLMHHGGRMVGHVRCRNKRMIGSRCIRWYWLGS